MDLNDQHPPAEQEKDQLIEQLRHEIGERDAFLAAVAHELRNPMTPILMQVNMLLASAQRDDGWHETALPRLERLQYAVNHYVKRATVLLDFSRINSGHRHLELSEVALSAVVREIVHEHELPARFVKSSLETNIQDEVVGAWDRLAIEQIVDNLLSNAIKYGGGKPILVSVAADASEARIVVRDQGPGISAEDQERIFGYFERAVTHRQHGGFGVGLWVVHQLVCAMQGSIALDSRPGEGSAFTVRLPLRLAEQQ